MAEGGQGGHRHVGHFEPVHLADHRAHVGLGFGGRTVGRETVVQGHRRPVGDHVVGHPALDPHDLQAFAEVTAVDGDLPALVGSHRGQQRGKAVDGVAAEPGPGGVGPLPGHRHLDPHGPLAPGLDPGRGRLGQQGGVAFDQVGALPEEALDAVEAGVDLLALVEDIGGVDDRLGDGAGQFDQDGHAALHVA